MRIPALAVLLGLCLSTGCTSSTYYGIAVHEATLTSNPPTLSWEKFPPAEGTDISDVTYEVRVIRENDGAVALSQKGVASTRYTLPEPLDASTAYRWSVRPWFLFRGERRVGPWAQRIPKGLHPGQTVVPVPIEYFDRILLEPRPTRSK